MYESGKLVSLLRVSINFHCVKFYRTVPCSTTCISNLILYLFHLFKKFVIHIMGLYYKTLINGIERLTNSFLMKVFYSEKHLIYCKNLNITKIELSLLRVY
jgi:hypothetical protein